MRLASIKVNGTEKAGIVLNRGILPIKALNAAKGTAWAEDMMSRKIWADCCVCRSTGRGDLYFCNLAA